jgi:hypothetical protein
MILSFVLPHLSTLDQAIKMPDAKSIVYQLKELAFLKQNYPEVLYDYRL